MNKPMRTFLAAAMLLLSFFSMPIWLPDVLANSNPNTDEVAGLSATPPLLLWSNNWQPDGTGIERNSPKLLAWQSTSGEVLWTLDTGFAYGAVIDTQNRRVYFVEEPVHRPYEPAGLLLLRIADLDSGELLSQTELRGGFFANTNSGAPTPVLLLGNTLYFTNHGITNNLAAYDLSTGRLGEERYDLCEKGYAMQFEYAPELDAIATLCIDYSSSEMKASLTRLSLADGSQLSLDLAYMGNKEAHTAANGLIVAGERAYAMNSDTYSIAEIDLETMQLLRQASYAQSNAWESALAWLLEQAASPAQAKMMFAVTALSPDGGRLAVGGSFLNGNRRELYLVDLDTLQTMQRIRTGGLLSRLAFAGPDTLIAVYENRDGWFWAATLDLSTSQETELATPTFGYLRELFVLGTE